MREWILHRRHPNIFKNFILYQAEYKLHTGYRDLSIIPFSAGDHNMRF